MRTQCIDLCPRHTTSILKSINVRETCFFLYDNKIADFEVWIPSELSGSNNNIERLESRSVVARDEQKFNLDQKLPLSPLCTYKAVQLILRMFLTYFRFLYFGGCKC